MRGRRYVAATCTGFALLSLAACGDGEPADFEALGIPAGAPVIDQDGLRFTPREVTTEVGEIVYFVNSETALHTVTIDGDDVTGDMRRDDVRSYVFEAPGEYRLTCDYHPQMRATVTVE